MMLQTKAVVVRRFCPLLLWPSLLLYVCAQELPHFTTPGTFNFTVSHRQSVCDRQQAFHNGTVELRDALMGFALRPWLPLSTSFSDLDPVTGGVPDSELPGLTIEMLDELARRGKFTWRNSFGVSNADDIAETGKNFDDLLYWALDTYDMAGTAFTKTFTRIGQGAVFPEGYLDGSIIMVGKQINQPKLNLWSFLEPFSWQVWLMILATFFVSGMVYLWMEWLNEDSDRQILGDKPTETLYFAALTFIGDNKFQPKTDFARLFIMGLSFFSLMVASAYTANLASFLVVQNTPSIQVNTVGEAVQARLSLCVIAGAAPQGLVANAYPSAILVPTDPTTLGEAGPLLGVSSGECDIGITTIASWDSLKGNSTVNQECHLDWVGRVFKFVQSGFVTHSDSGTLCTSLIRDVINLHMLEMEEDGFTASVLAKYQEAAADQKCDGRLQDDFTNSDDSSRQLGLQDLGGLFIVFYGLVIVTGAMALFVKWRLDGTKKTDDPRKKGAQNREVAPASHGDDAMSSNGQVAIPSSSNADDLLRQLARIQRELDEALRHATELKSSPETGAKRSVHTSVE